MTDHPYFKVTFLKNKNLKFFIFLQIMKKLEKEYLFIPQYWIFTVIEIQKQLTNELISIFKDCYYLDQNDLTHLKRLRIKPGNKQIV